MGGPPWDKSRGPGLGPPQAQDHEASHCLRLLLFRLGVAWLGGSHSCREQVEGTMGWGRGRDLGLGPTLRAGKGSLRRKVEGRREGSVHGGRTEGHGRVQAAAGGLIIWVLGRMGRASGSCQRPHVHSAWPVAFGNQDAWALRQGLPTHLSMWAREAGQMGPHCLIFQEKLEIWFSTNLI